MFSLSAQPINPVVSSQFKSVAIFTTGKITYDTSKSVGYFGMQRNFVFKTIEGELFNTCFKSNRSK